MSPDKFVHFAILQDSKASGWLTRLGAGALTPVPDSSDACGGENSQASGASHS